MKVELVNPKLKTWSPNVYPPLGISYVAAVLEEQGHEVGILDMNSRKVSDGEMLKRVGDVDMVGITGMVTEYSEVVRLSQVLKEDSRGRTVVLGGPLATTHTEEVLLASGADVAVLGEGEVTVTELVRLLRDGEGADGVKGTAHRVNGTVRINSPREPIRNLDVLPLPARHLLDMDRYTTHHFKSFGLKVKDTRSCTLVSSRGCPYKCSYCFKDVWGHKWRARSPRDIVDEIWELYWRYKFKGFVFNDDTFVMNRDRVLEFCRELQESGLQDVSWYCNGRVNLMDEEVLEAMAGSGCRGVAYGIESGNQGILDAIRKKITLEQVERITAATKRAGMQVTGYFMLGILGDSRETIQETLDFAERLGLDFYGFAVTSPILGTPMHDQARELGMVTEKRLEDWSFGVSVNLTQDCSDRELEEFNSYAFRKFTIEKRYGERYLVNPRLWWDGFKSLLFLLRKRDVSVLVRKALSVLKH